MQKNGIESTITIDNKTYKLSRFEMHLMLDFLEWSKEVLPNPLKELTEVINDYPERLQDKLLKKAEERMDRRGSVNDPEVEQLLHTPKGLSKVFSLMLKKYHPEITAQEGDRLFRLGCEELGEVAFLHALGNAMGQSATTEQEVEKAYFPKSRSSSRIANAKV